MRRCGIAIEIDFHERDKQPCLVNLAADPMLSGTLLYLIPPGLVRIGKNKNGSEAISRKLDILLDGPLVRELHWLVTDCVRVGFFIVCRFYGVFIALCLDKEWKKERKWNESARERENERENVSLASKVEFSSFSKYFSYVVSFCINNFKKVSGHDSWLSATIRTNSKIE